MLLNIIIYVNNRSLCSKATVFVYHVRLLYELYYFSIKDSNVMFVRSQVSKSHRKTLRWCQLSSSLRGGMYS